MKLKPFVFEKGQEESDKDYYDWLKNLSMSESTRQGILAHVRSVNENPAQNIPLANTPLSRSRRRQRRRTRAQDWFIRNFLND